VRKAKTNYFSKLIEEAGGNSSKLWQHINRITNSSRQKHLQINGLKDGQVQTHSNEAIANVFNTFFINSVRELASNFKYIKSSPEESDNAHTDFFCIKEVSCDKVKKVIVNMSNSMSKDIYNIHATLIKRNESCLLEPITYLINLSIQTKTFPESWKTAIITPIYKTGDKDLASNYRPIAILPVVSKVLEKIVAEQLAEHLESNQLLYPLQFGFRDKYSTGEVD